MRPTLEKNWLSYLYTGAMIVFTTWAVGSLSGCRFGNYVEAQTNPDTITGYYETQPQTLTFCAVTGSALHETCKDAATNLVPTEISRVITNPLVLGMSNLSTGDAVFAAADPSGHILRNSAGNYIQLPTNVGTAPQLQIVFDGSAPAFTLFTDKACTIATNVIEEGQVIQGGALLLTSPVSRKGRITLKMQLFQEIVGDCAASLQAMHDCYNDVNACGGGSAAANAQLQTLAIATFDAYIQAGAMTAADIPTASKLSYVVTYQ